jgi:hypothetical protein
MIEQVSNSVKFVAFFTANKTGTTGLTVTVDVYNPSGTQIVTAASATAIGGGLYGYTLSTNNSSEGEYAAIFKTTDSTVDSQHIPSLWVLGRAGVENLDSSVSSRSTLTAAQVNAEADTALADVGLTSTVTGRIDAAISSRLSPSGTLAVVTTLTNAPASVTPAQIRAEMDANSTKLANLDATVSSRLATSGYTAPSAAPTAAQNATAVRTELGTELGRIDAAISSRLSPSGTLATVTTLTNAPSVPSASAIASQVRSELSTELARVDVATSTRLAGSAYSAPANSDITAIKAKTDNLPASPAATGDIPSANITAIKAKTDLLNTDRLAQVSTVSTTGAQLAAALS